MVICKFIIGMVLFGGARYFIYLDVEREDGCRPEVLHIPQFYGVGVVRARNERGERVEVGEDYDT